MRAKLVVVGGDAKATEIQLKLPTIVGRGRNASLTLPHPLVSRQHCEIVESNGRLLVRDLGSMNGTFIGNERITEAVLPPGELLTIGTVTFRAVYEEGVVPPSRAAQSAEETLPKAAGETIDFQTPDDELLSDNDEDEDEEPDTPPLDALGPPDAMQSPDAMETEPVPPQSSAQRASLSTSPNEATTLPDQDAQPGLFVDAHHDDSSEELHLGEAPEDGVSEHESEIDPNRDNGQDQDQQPDADDQLRSFLRGLN